MGPLPQLPLADILTAWKVNMKIQGIEKVSMVDYPNKIATTIFTGGCNFRCPFCHNSGIVNQQYPYIEESEIFDYLKSRTKLIDAVVVSGGEPTLQPDLEEFIVKIRELGFLVKLDTNGTNPFMLKKLLDKNLLDYVAMDIKNDFEDYDKITGIKEINVENVKKSLDILHKYDTPYELRTTLINEFHKEENIEKMAKELAGEHVLYLQKFVDTETCFEHGLTEVDKMNAVYYAGILKKTINNVILRGY